jgi:hypothetical protein
MHVMRLCTIKYRRIQSQAFSIDNVPRFFQPHPFLVVMNFTS